MREHLHLELRSAKYVVFIDDSGRYTDCSDEVSDLVGYDRSEILSMHIGNLSFDKAGVPSLFDQYKRDRNLDGEYILQHKNGASILIRYQAWVFADGCHAAVWEPAEEWEQSFFAALIETNSSKLREKVNAALGAIHRRQLMAGVGDTPEIRQKLRDAYESLRALLS